MIEPLRALVNRMTFKPRNGAADGYLFDLDGGERFTRPKTGTDIFPIQDNATVFQKLGNVNPVLPLFNWFVWGQGYGKVPFGPIMSAIPDNLQWQILVPGLNKQMPNS